MNPSYPTVALRAGHRCEYCRAPEAVANFPFEVEHIIPRSRGGMDSIENTALACRSCNLYKSDALTAIDPETELEAPLYHPRNDRWDEHFVYDAHKGGIHGRTAVGRATVGRLQMNSDYQQAARRVWRRLDLY